jgi:hypothetical protein
MKSRGWHFWPAIAATITDPFDRSRGNLEAPKGRQVRLSHVAFGLNDETALVKAYRELKERQVTINFTVDPGITRGVFPRSGRQSTRSLSRRPARGARRQVGRCYMGMDHPNSRLRTPVWATWSRP